VKKLVLEVKIRNPLTNDRPGKRRLRIFLEDIPSEQKNFTKCHINEHMDESLHYIQACDVANFGKSLPEFRRNVRTPSQEAKSK
jgi:hypothetical protein